MALRADEGYGPSGSSKGGVCSWHIGAFIVQCTIGAIELLQCSNELPCMAGAMCYGAPTEAIPPPVYRRCGHGHPSYRQEGD